MRILDAIKDKCEVVISLIERRIEEKMLEKAVRIANEKARIQQVLDSEINWDYVVELECEYADENEDVCYIKKYVRCNVPRDEIWLQKEVDGIIITGKDLGRSITLNVGKNFYRKRQVSFWDDFDNKWHGYEGTPDLSDQPFKFVRELNEYVNAYNQKCIDGMGQHDNSVITTKR